MRVLPSGDRAVLVELDDQQQVLGLYALLRTRPPHAVLGCVPAARTVLVEFDPASTTARALAADLTARSGHLAVDAPDADGGEPRPSIEVPVRYDGEDLAEVAQLTGLTIDEVVARHSGATYTCAFCGFAPGFAYLTGLDPVLHVPRRASPRQAVPAGAVGVADEFSAVYPHRSPGGWRILGHTDRVLWDLDRDPPALVEPGAVVRFVPVS